MTLDETELPRVQVIGFTGHRHLKNPTAVGEIIRSELERLRSESDGKIAGYSSVAIGADTLFAEACLASDVPWRAILPFALADFRDDFTDDEWSHATNLLGHAVSVEISESQEDRTAAYLSCGLRTVDGADLILAVWDGNPARGIGGTAEIVEYARTKNKPLILIHPDHPEVNHED
jgi:hypothetical protein